MPYKGSDLKLETGKLKPNLIVTADYRLTPDKVPMLQTAIDARNRYSKDLKILLV